MNQHDGSKAARRYRRASVWMRLGTSIMLIGGFFTSCAANNLPDTTRDDAIDIAQDLFNFVIVDPVVNYVNDRIANGLNSIFGVGEA